MRWIVIFIIGISLMFCASVYAAEGIISPIPEPQPALSSVTIAKPAVSFGDLLRIIPDTRAVLGATSSALITPTPPLPVNREPVAETRSTRKRDMTITLLGDSMVDTLGPVGGGLASMLNRTYPNTIFTIMNHGVGAENIDSGLKRLTSAYSYLGLGRNAVVNERPDVIVIESFGYNPYPLPDVNDALNRHWLKFAEMIDTIRREAPETMIVIAATIAPNWDVFGDGAAGLSFSPEGKRTKVEEIKRYIENAIAFAKSQGLPLADAYTPSLDSSGNGKTQYINAGDHIHYSNQGRVLMLQKIADSIIANRLLE